MSRFAAVWSAGDHDSVAGFVVDKGAVISLTHRPLSNQTVTPARARYLYRSLFRGVTGQNLELTKISTTTDRGSAHAVFTWTRRRGGRTREERLFTSWTLWQGRWRMSELRLGR